MPAGFQKRLNPSGEPSKAGILQGAYLKYMLMFMLLYFLIYMGEALYGLYVPLFLDRLGFDSSKIGAVLAVSPMIAMFVQPFWGMITDRAPSKNIILVILLIGAASAFFFIPFVSKWFPALFFLIIMYNVFRSSTQGITDTITLEYIDSTKGKFGPVRMLGTIGYAIMSIIAGYVAGIRLENIFWMFAIPSFLAVILLFFLPTIKGHMKKGSKVSIKSLLQNRELLLLMLIGLIFQSTSGFYYSFYSLYFTNDLGGSTTFLGLIISFSAIAELPFLFFSDRLIKRFGIKNLMLTACLAGSLRWVLTALIQNPQLQFYVQLLHGINGIVFMFCMAVFINQNMPKEIKASGQTFYSFIIAIGSRIIGSWLGGILCGYVSMRYVFYLNSFLLLATVIIIVLITGRNKKKAPDKNS